MASQTENAGLVRQRSTLAASGVARVARFKLTGEALPAVEATLPFADRFRRALMGVFNRLEQQRLGLDPRDPAALLPSSPMLSGKDRDGEPLRGHVHSFYLPTDEDADGRIDHMTVLCDAGFHDREICCLERLQWIWSGYENQLRVRLVALAGPSELAPPTVADASAWVSATPFVASRHPKRRGRRRDRPELLEPGNFESFVASVLLEEIDRLRVRRPEVPLPSEISPILGNDGKYCIPACGIPARRFERSRSRHGGDDACRPFGAFRIVFPSLVRGPLCLGRSCHFGMGLFVPQS